MGTSNISSVGKIFAQGQTTGTTAVANEEDVQIAFTEVMSQMTNMVGSGLQTDSQIMNADKNAVSLERTSATENYDRYQCRETIKQQDSNADLAQKDVVSDKMDSYAKDVKDVLKEEFGVTDEQIEEAMENLGLTFADLMNPNQLATLVMELTGVESVSALLCDGDFLTVMQAVGELGENLLQELGVSADELAQLLAASNVQGDAKMTGLMDETLEDTAAVETETETGAQTAFDATLNAEDQSVSEGQMVASDDTEESVEIVDERTTEDGTEDQMADESEAGLNEVESAFDKRNETSARNGAASGQESQMANGSNVASNQSMTEAVNVQQTAGTMEFSSQLDVNNIIRQIVEYSKVTLSNQATTMEMQLNPENLGKIYLEVTSKDGVVSAHITAQNDIVKEALESQIVELRQNMNQAGVKVEAVEVTVGSHEFEKNLEQNAKQEERQAEEQEKAAKQTRRINLNELDELGGLMTEEENLVAQMMADQGNSIDYTA